MDNIDKVRRFNRFYTRQMAFFSRDYVRSGLSVTEIRILREIAEGGVHTAREISRDLEVDEGYLSRVIRNFVSEGWLVQKRSDADARRKILDVTEAGLALFNDLRDRSAAICMAVLTSCQVRGTSTPMGSGPGGYASMPEGPGT